jgi:hypothetical protein
MKPSVIVWDLETVPDLGGFAAANDLVGKSDVGCARLIYHSGVSILVANRENASRRAVWRGLIEYQRSDIGCLILKAKMI